MIDLKQKEIFRLAAVLYAENNYEVSPKTIHRKIIESVLLDNSNKPCTIHGIIDLIENNYGFIFDYDEVFEIIDEGKSEFFLVGNLNADLTVCLNSKRVSLLSIKVNQNNIDYFIQEFLNSHKELIASLDGKAIIYKFLYEVFSNNISSFSRLIDHKKELDGAINIDNSFNAIEKEIINSFLKWDNDGKNKAIFDISSYALEYCLITNNVTSNTFHLKNLRNKDFYLDTNILFRIIGINGESRKSRTITFLNKFNEAGETLIISKFTEAEYKSTIKHYIDQINKKNISRVNPSLFIKYNNESGFFDYYHRWRINRTNDSTKYFEAHLLSEYEDLKKKFSIKEDYKIPYEEKNEDVKKLIDALSADIYSFKNSENNGVVRFETTITDAKNIYLIKERRDGNSRNIFETKYFFVSADQALRRWDFKSNLLTPIVLLPSQWLSILLRYVNRTNDDFKSFVSFLNLSQNETNITNEKLQLILIGISEITQDVNKQSAIVEVMVEQKFKGILENNSTEDEIVERSRVFARTELEKRLDEIEEINHALSESLDSHIKGTNAAFYELEVEQQEKISSVKELELENRKLKRELRDRYVKGKFRLWQTQGYVCIPLITFLICLYILLFIFQGWNYNYPHIVAKWIDTLPKDSIQKDFAHYIYLAPLAGIAPLSLVAFNRLLNKEKRFNQAKNIENSTPQHYL